MPTLRRKKSRPPRRKSFQYKRRAPRDTIGKERDTIMEQIKKIDRRLGTWSFLRAGWWVLHIAAIAIVFWLGMWMASGY